MDKIKFEELVARRIESELKIAQEKLEKEKQTINYFYKQILIEFVDEIQKSIVSYNEILSNNYKDLQMFLYFGNSYETKLERSGGREIMILMNKKSASLPTNSTQKTNFDHCIISFESEPGLEENYFYSSNYIIKTDRGYERKSLRLDINEANKEKIVSELKSFFGVFLEAYFERGDALNKMG